MCVSRGLTNALHNMTSVTVVTKIESDPLRDRALQFHIEHRISECIRGILGMSMNLNLDNKVIRLYSLHMATQM